MWPDQDFQALESKILGVFNFIPHFVFLKKVYKTYMDLIFVVKNPQCIIINPLLTR